MIRRIAAITAIFICTTIAWIILGSTILYRTYHWDPQLRQKVTESWGAPQEQTSPTATYSTKISRNRQSLVDGKVVEKVEEETVTTPLPLESSKVDVALNLDYRQKGLLWYSTYQVAFTGVYAFRNNTDQDRRVTFALRLPADHAVYDDLVLLVDGKAATANSIDGGVVHTAVLMPPGTLTHFDISYKSQGLDGWRYRISTEVSQVRNFTLRMRTNFQDIDFPDNSLSPTTKREAGSGWLLTWDYRNLVSGYQIALTMPERLQPGPLAGEISYFAPVSLFFYFFVIFLITTIRRIDLHPMNYFFLAAAFFAFHLLLAYLVDHILIHGAFAVASAVSVGLAVSYLRLAVGAQFATREAAIAQIVYLVLFSYAFFFKGFTGLAVTIGAVITLFVAMQMTGRIQWSKQFGPPALPVGGSTAPVRPM
jgi:inner membrane protein involved in colicin E2 resistance